MSEDLSRGSTTMDDGAGSDRPGIREIDLSNLRSQTGNVLEEKRKHTKKRKHTSQEMLLCNLYLKPSQV